MDAAYDYDLLVIGSGPGGQKAAIAAAKLGKRVAVAERRTMMGGVCVNTGTIPSKTLREAVLYLTGFAQRDMYGASYRVKSEITIADLLARTPARGRPRGRGDPQPSCCATTSTSSAAPRRFVDPHTVGRRGRRTAATTRRSPPSTIVIATGTKPARPSHGRVRRRRTSSTPTASCGSSGCRARWSSSAPG